MAHRGVLAAMVVAKLNLASALVGQQWSDVGLRTPAGAIALDQARRDAQADALFLLVASHPDDRYILPGVWLRRVYGARVAVLLLTRGGGGQNSIGSETGDALERIRTLETEVGCEAFGAEVWHLDRPDAGYRRSAEATFAEWGREETLRDLARAIRRLRPDAVLTTHHPEEPHGHDLAIVELLPLAVALAADARFASPEPPHTVATFCLGAGSSWSERSWTIEADRLDPVLGVTLRRHAYEILRGAHQSPGPPLPLDSVFGARMRFEPHVEDAWRPDGGAAMPSLFDGRWTEAPSRVGELAVFFESLPQRQVVAEDLVPILGEMRRLRDAVLPSDVAARLDRRIEALERWLLLLCGLQIEVDVPPGAVAVSGEELSVTAHLHKVDERPVRWSVAGLHGVEATMLVAGSAVDRSTDASRVSIAVRVPTDDGGDAMARRFRAPRFEPPVQLRFTVQAAGISIPVTMRLPIEQRPPAEMHLVPRMLLLPTGRDSLQFRVVVTRNSRFPIESDLEVRGAAGYALREDRARVALREQRSDTFGFEVRAPAERRLGVDVLRIRLGRDRVDLPVHKIDVTAPRGLRIGIVRSRDDTLAAVLGAGGLGLDCAELSDSDVAVADLTQNDTVVIDIRALRDRPAVRNSFRRLLEFAQQRHRRLLVLYQKDVEFHPPGEGFLGAPYLPFQVGRARVTRADAPVRVLRPAHVLLNHPNTIRAADWDGWEQERGLYLPSVWADEYEELLEMHDPGQPPERGALLYARTGGGEFVYCALSLWRQLKKLHPGAVRLVANLLTPAGRA